MRKYNVLPLILALACGPSIQNAMDKLATASSLICDSLRLHDEYKDEVQVIKELIEAKDYASALFMVKQLYTVAQENGDTAAVEQLVPLMTTLQQLASKLPLSVQKPEAGHKLL